MIGLAKFLRKHAPTVSTETINLVYDLQPLYIENDIVVLCGISVNATGVYHLWMMCEEGVTSKYPISLVRHLRNVDMLLRNKYQARRIELDIKADSKVDRNFAEFFGFHEESLMPGFGPNGETYAKYVRLAGG